MQANFLDTQTSNVLYRQKVYFAFVKQRLLCLRVLLIRLGYASSTSSFLASLVFFHRRPPWFDFAARMPMCLESLPDLIRPACSDLACRAFWMLYNVRLRQCLIADSPSD